MQGLKDSLLLPIFLGKPCDDVFLQIAEYIELRWQSSREDPALPTAGGLGSIPGQGTKIS